jgi:hypothetical protein
VIVIILRQQDSVFSPEEASSWLFPGSVRTQEREFKEGEKEIVTEIDFE